VEDNDKAPHLRIIVSERSTRKNAAMLTKSACAAHTEKTNEALSNREEVLSKTVSS
jgi:hypothetical protein